MPTKRKLKAKKRNIGGDFDDFLKEEGIYEECHATALKRVLSFRFQEVMKQLELTKTGLAEQMGTSRSALDRLLDPENPSVTLDTIVRAAKATGQHVELRIVDAA
jgi:predicted XRE-type DNA-binding protein